MKITEKAKLLLMEKFVSNNCDCLQATLEKSCCGTSLNFTLAKLKADDKPVSIDGVSVLMDNQSEARTDTVTIAIEDGELIIQDDAPSCCS